MYISPEAQTILIIFAITAAAVFIAWVVVWFLVKLITKTIAWMKASFTNSDRRLAESLQELADKVKELGLEPHLPPPNSAPVKKTPPKPVDPNDIQISGPIPIIGSEDVSQSKTQPIPVVGEAEVVAMGGGGGEPTKVLQIQDHVLESFYRKLADPKTYDWTGIPESFKARFGVGAKSIIFEPYVPYDTYGVTPNLWEMQYFTLPMGQAGKTQLETNLQMYGVLSYAPMGDFAHQTTVIRFIGDASKEDVKKVLESGVYELHDCSTYTRPVQSPLSSFVPLNPFDPDPKVFFLTHKTVFLREYHTVNVFIRFPHGLGPIGLFKLKVELPGLAMRPDWMKGERHA